MHGRTPSGFPTVEGEAKWLSVPKLCGSPFGTLIDGAKLTRRAKYAKIQNSAGTLCRLMHRQSIQMKNLTQNAFKLGEPDAKTACHSKTVFVKQITMETLNAKPSLLHFLH